MKKLIYILLSLCIICSWGIRVQTVDNVSEALNKRLLDMEWRQSVCEKKIKDLETSCQKSTVRRRSVTGQHVAFSTLLTTNQKNIGLSQTIKFDKILLNDGAGYRKYSGVFTVPVSGVYMFSYFFGHGYSHGQIWLRLMHNGQKVNAGVTDTFHNNQDLQGGNTAIIRAHVGDTIWIESFHQNDASLYGIIGFTSFSGVLLY
ncbi:complement C1q tumor necrosis factor-related protein 2-like [Mercenaria mercenaria]|uniref:complement C1q tumor necrosis factor-related protein 2-like n=1 Tax=Mercenaria mercenaria TaxID=6596 RepID=UPI001E1DA63B|nr:complement C1q tumor necrosis factor-related protein 2-like [Mercenaria mercenaria]